MKKIIFFFLIMIPCFAFAQVGIKAGLNFANVTNASSINNKSRTGFHAGLLLGSSFHKIIGFRTELMYSGQGYEYTSGNSKGHIRLNYITSTDLVTIGISRYFQIQAGFRLAYLLNAKADSSNQIAGLPGSSQKILDFYNRLDYGFAGGIEIHPIRGLLIGARFNFSLSKLYKDAENGQSGSFSNADLKNNVFQLFTGWRFGK